MHTADEGATERSYLRITRADLRRLASIAQADLTDFLARSERARTQLEGRYLCTALCQGAALHAIDGKNGIKDWDVWMFFGREPGDIYQFPYRRRIERSFGEPRFGRSLTRSDHVGRCVDLLGRYIFADAGEDPTAAVRRYLSQGGSRSACLLAAKAVVMVDPESGVARWFGLSKPLGLA
ncbi:MAG: hypothetical protein KDK91_24740 [Gammaproteobacteria bacterium]|nr:hypothetical protein [Gammaproteobacteria bacterium]